MMTPGPGAPKQTESDVPANLQGELLSIQRALVQMDRKIDNKKINEVTASYMLHNATDAIGNKVPTAAQVTLDQISTYQQRVSQRVDAIDARMARIEGLLNRNVHN
uniref:Uncharacterized protein n=2 Tax=Hemiselmis andersenii TaxID=464988 RepID=A0A7S0U1S2_HEMAN|mmetsp:Transcript_29024/g.67907  ORF Transcript_29024/g.67907 Transcript_29024/m.67907 type:complete len:106 (+) Transcript_29024:2-319(+)